MFTISLFTRIKKVYLPRRREQVSNHNNRKMPQIAIGVTSQKIKKRSGEIIDFIEQKICKNRSEQVNPGQFTIILLNWF